jgi:hypothetical protein
MEDLENTRHSEEPDATAPRVEPSDPKRPYATPQLFVLGSVVELTRGGAGTKFDGGTRRS